MSVLDFEHKVQYGTVEGPLMECLFRLMQGIYVPVFDENTKWPDSVKKESFRCTNLWLY